MELDGFEIEIFNQYDLDTTKKSKYMSPLLSYEKEKQGKMHDA